MTITVGLVLTKLRNMGNKEEHNKQTGDSDIVVAAATGGGKGATPRTPTQNGPCWFFHSTTCSKGKDCTFSHGNLSKEEKDKLAQPEPRGRSESKGPNEEGKGRGTSQKSDGSVKKERGRG